MARCRGLKTVLGDTVPKPELSGNNYLGFRKRDT